MASESRHTLPHHHLLPEHVEKEGSPRRLNFGLLSPNSSFSSLSSSSSHPVSSPRKQPHYAPRTPLRSVHKPQPPASPSRSSPLFRLLLPPSPLPTQTSRPSSPDMALHQPVPHYSHPASPVVSPRQLATVPNTRPPSRSERMLRDLLKDEMERNAVNVPVPPSPYLSTSHYPNASSSTAPSKAHRRRHSHVPTSSTAATHDSQYREREEYTRGSYLFRTAMSNPRAPSPSSSSGGEATQNVLYGGDAETHYLGSGPQRRALSPVSNTRSRRSGFSPTRDVSPSPMGRRQESRQRPSHLPLEPSSSGLQRHHTIHTSPRGSGRASQHQSPPMSRRPRSPDGRSPPRGEPLVMTPHEQVLRARLEKVLSSGKVVDGRQRDRQPERGRSQSGSRRSNEVMDEEGSWPWREREAALKSNGSITTSPLVSSNSGSSLSQSSHSQFATFAPNMSRARSKTDPTPPSLPKHRSTAPSPRRSTTAPSGVSSPSYSRRPFVQQSGTTPPLIPDSSPLLGPSTPADGEAEDDNLHLLTPPPTPPCTSKVFALNGNAAVRQDGYCPSPYKIGFPPNVNAYTTTRRGPAQVQGATRLGSARRPANAPVDDRYSSRSSERLRNRGDDCDDEQSSSCSSRSFPGSDDFFAHHAHHLPNSPPADLAAHVASGMRPQFNARKASAQCRAMEGYVSFANVEGLGMPPDDPSAGDHPDGEGRRRGEYERGRGMLAWGFRKLLGVGHVEGGDREHPHRNADGVVL